MLLAFVLANQSYFYLIAWASNLIVGLAIGGAMLAGVEVVVGFSRWFLWKILIHF